MFYYNVQLQLDFHNTSKQDLYKGQICNVFPFLSEENNKVSTATYVRQTSTRPRRRTVTCVAAVLHLFDIYLSDTALTLASTIQNLLCLILTALHHNGFLPAKRSLAASSCRRLRLVGLKTNVLKSCLS